MGTVNAQLKLKELHRQQCLTAQKVNYTSSSLIICISHVFTTNYLWPIKNSCSSRHKGGGKKRQMPRPNSLRVKTGLEKGGDTEHTHMCRPMKMHLQLFPLACWQWGWLQWLGSETACFPLCSGKSLSQNLTPLQLPMNQEQPWCNNSTSHSWGRGRQSLGLQGVFQRRVQREKAFFRRSNSHGRAAAKHPHRHPQEVDVITLAVLLIALMFLSYRWRNKFGKIKQFFRSRN